MALHLVYRMFVDLPVSNKESYVGVTKNFSTRKSLHKSRFYETTEGSNYFVYDQMRTFTRNWDNVSFEVLRAFNTKRDAKRFEKKMIKEIGTLNTQLR